MDINNELKIAGVVHNELVGWLDLRGYPFWAAFVHDVWVHISTSGDSVSCECSLQAALNFDGLALDLSTFTDLLTTGYWRYGVGDDESAVAVAFGAGFDYTRAYPTEAAWRDYTWDDNVYMPWGALKQQLLGMRAWIGCDITYNGGSSFPRSLLHGAMPPIFTTSICMDTARLLNGTTSTAIDHGILLVPTAESSINAVRAIMFEVSDFELRIEALFFDEARESLAFLYNIGSGVVSGELRSTTIIPTSDYTAKELTAAYQHIACYVLHNLSMLDATGYIDCLTVDNNATPPCIALSTLPMRPRHIGSVSRRYAKADAGGTHKSPVPHIRRAHTRNVKGKAVPVRQTSVRSQDP